MNRATPAILLIVGMPARAQQTPTWQDFGALFDERCTICHSGENAPLGLRLDALDHALEGSENGPVLVPHDPAGRELIRRVKGQCQPRIPLTGPPLLDKDDVRLIRH